MSLDDNWELFEPSLTPSERKLREAASILRQLGFDPPQYNMAACYTLLAFLDLGPDASWSSAKSPLLGTTPAMHAMKRLYGHEYKQNTREGIRDDAIKFFVEHGLLLRNPDKPDRATTGKVVYQIEPSALELIRAYRTSDWHEKLKLYLGKVDGIRREIKRHRESFRVPVRLPDGTQVTLSPGGQNPLIKAIVESFCERYTPDGVVLYLGDTESKFENYTIPALRKLGVELSPSSKMPDVIVHHVSENWLLLIEAVTSAGPVDGKRRKELKELFGGSTAGLVFVTAFPDRATFRKFVAKISWESEVWLADEPEHMIHFNGERFLGPYPDVMP